MASSRISHISFALASICALVGFLSTTADVIAQTTQPKFLSGPPFVLSNEAAAAGIDGTLTVSVKVTKTGAVKDVDIIGGPIWPCNTSPDAEIKAVREAVQANVMAVMFEPATKDGKPDDAELVLDFAIGQAYREAVREEEAKKVSASGKSPRIVDAGMINGRAIRLVKPALSGVSGVAVVRVIIDEQGNVASAGGVRGIPSLFANSRRAACESKFSPTIIHGRPVRVSGVLTYNFVAGGRR